MKKVYLIIKNLILCSLFFSILIYLLAFFAPLFRYEEDHLSTGSLSSFYAEEKDTVDVVFVGASSVYRFMAPTVMYKKYGITSMNFSTAAMPIECINGVIDEVISNQHPKLIMVEIRDYLKYAEYHEKGKDLLTDSIIKKRESYLSRLVNNMPVSLARARIIHEAVPPVLGQSELGWQFEYYKTHNNWKNLTADDIKEYIYENLSGKKTIKNIDNKYYGADYKGTIAGGFVNYNEATDRSNYNKIKAIPDDWFEVMKGIVKNVKAKDTKIVFYTTPYPENDLRASYENYLAEYYKEQNIEFLNCNKYYDEIGLDFASDYYDKKHTNVKGAVKTTEFIGKYITEKLGFEKTELSESKAKEWQEASDKWYKEICDPATEKINNYVSKQKAKGNTDY